MNIALALRWSVVAFASLAVCFPANAQECPPCDGDLDGSGEIDGADLGMLLRDWCTDEECSLIADINEDGFVDGGDLGILLANWGSCATGTTCPLQVVADTNRDGSIDNADLPGRAAWTPARGAFYLVNVDDDKKSAAGQSDSCEFDKDADAVIIDDKINNGGDGLDITHFMVKRIGAFNAATDTVWLKAASVDQMEAVHIFGTVNSGATAIAGGPNYGSDEVEITPYVSRTQNRTLGLEGLKYRLVAGGVAGLPADMLFDGFVQLTVELRRAGAVVGSDTVLLKVAPWIMSCNTLGAERLFAKPFQVPVVPAAGGAAVLTANDQFFTDLKSGLPANTVVSFTTDTQWAQDDIEFGYSQTPKSLVRVAAYSRHHDSSDDPAAEGTGVIGDAQWRRDLLMGGAPVMKDIGHYRMPRPVGADSGDYGGNIELLPPTTVHPLGRVCYGNIISDMKRAFFASQEVQPAFEVDTNWLRVGHVDEMVGFWKDAPLTVILASPRLAYKELGFDGGVFPAAPANAKRTDDGGSGIPVPESAVFFSEGDTAAGIATGGTITTLQDTSANFLASGTPWGYVRIYAGTGAGQTAHIAAIPNSSTIIIDAVWSNYDYTQPVNVEATSAPAASASGTIGFASVSSSTWSVPPDRSSRYVLVEDTKWWNAPASVLAGVVFPADKTPATLTKADFDPAAAKGAKMRTLNVEVQKRIDDARAKIKAAAAPDAVTFVEVPVLYNGRLDALDALVDRWCFAFTPGAANVVIGNGKVFVPAQKGPQWKNAAGGMTKAFDDLIKAALGGAGNVVFVEDWDHYHALLGEVHCGTNVLRKPYAFKWWTKQPAGIPNLP